MKQLIIGALAFLVFSSSVALASCSTSPSLADAERHLATGYDLQQSGQWLEAIDELTKAIEMNPNLAYAHIYRGNCYDALAQYDRALADETRAIELKPKDAFAYYSRGETYLHKGNLDSTLLSNAITDFTKAIQLNPKDTDAYESRSIAYARNKEFELADADFNHIRQLSNNAAMIDELSRYLSEARKAQMPTGFVPTPAGPSDDATVLAPARGLTGIWVGSGVFYTTNMMGERASKVNAKIVLTLEQKGNAVTGGYQIYPTDQQPLTDIWVPLVSGSGRAIAGTTSITNLTLDAGGIIYGGRDAIEEWRFTFTTDTMNGGVTNMDMDSYTGLDSDPKAISLARQ